MKFFLTMMYLVIAASLSQAQSAASDQMTDQLIVKFKEGKKTQRIAVRMRLTSFVSQELGDSVISTSKKIYDGSEVWKLKNTHTNLELEQLAKKLSQQDGIEIAEPDYYNKISLVPNDPYYGYQGYLARDFYSGSGINVQGAWDIATGANVRVAVLDTGYLPHPDLLPNIAIVNNAVYGYDFVSDTATSGDGDGADANPTDPGDGNILVSRASTWHGTQTSGVIAAATNNSIGMVGVAFNAKIVPVRVLGKGGGYDSDIINGIIWAGKPSPGGFGGTKASIMNLSLGGQHPCSSSMQNAINQVIIPIVVAAGNDGVDATQSSPANCLGTTVVGATQPSDGGGGRSTSGVGRPSFSNYGPKVDFVAMGVNVLAPSNDGVYVVGPNYTYVLNSGTSFSAPLVTGVLALILSAPQHKFGVDRKEITRRMAETSDKAYCWDPFSGNCDSTSPYKRAPNATRALSSSAVFVRNASFSGSSMNETSTINTTNQVVSGVGPYTYQWSSADSSITFNSTTSATPQITHRFPAGSCTGSSWVTYNTTVHEKVTDSSNGQVSETDQQLTFQGCYLGGG